MVSTNKFFLLNEDNEPEGKGRQLGNIKEGVENILDLLNFDGTDSEDYIDQDEKSEVDDVNFLSSSSSELVNMSDIARETQAEVPSGPCLQNAPLDPPVGNNGEGEPHGIDQTPEIASGTIQSQTATTGDQTQRTEIRTSGWIPLGCKDESQRGIRRRCLVFEGAGGSKKISNPNNSELQPSMASPSNGKLSLDKQLVPFRPLSNSSPCPLPGIGLHLNTLATTSKEKMVIKENSTVGRRVISTAFSNGTFIPITGSQKPMNRSLYVNDQCFIGSGVQDLEVRHDDVSEVPVVGVGDNSSHSSPKKKRRKSETGGESEATRRCNCKKSKCLKLYCECFALGEYCSEACSCQGCINTDIHAETVLSTRKQIESRNPIAFAPKVIPASGNMGEESNKTPASARHKRGCNCKKSNCLKKYCECYQGGAACSASCRCEGCQNRFGRKDGAEQIEQEEKEMDDCKRPRGDDQRSAFNPNDEQQLSETVLPITPFQNCRPLSKLPFSSGKPPRSSTLSIGYSTSQTIRKCPTSLLQPKGEKQLAIVPDDDTPAILRSNVSPKSGVKIASPNRKRVSPPHDDGGISPSRKGVRKLILTPVRSFPSLTDDDASNGWMSCSSFPFDPSTSS